MTEEEIRQLDLVLAEGRDVEEALSVEQIDKILADLAEHKGWEILKNKIARRIRSYLEPVKKEEFEAVPNLEIIGGLAIARSEVVEALRGVISEVESVRSANKKDEKK